MICTILTAFILPLQIWDLSDPNGQGFLDKRGFYVAMKLVALAQMGTDLSINNILQETPNPPKLVSSPLGVSHFIR